MAKRRRPGSRRRPWAAAPLVVVLLGVATLSTGAAESQPEDRPAPVPLVRLPFPQDDGSLTPYTFELGYPLVTLVYDTLMWRDEQGVPQPWLARSVEPSADGRRITVTLTPGVTWHDGAPLTSRDVAFTFEFVARRPHPRFTPELRALAGVDAPDPATVVFRLRRPSPGFLDQPLADVPILPAHLWDDLRPGQLAPEGLAVGSGPYRLVEHQHGSHYRFEANDGYFRGPPGAKTIEVPIVEDAEGTVQALEDRRVDMIPASLPEAATVRLRGHGVRIVTGPSYVGTVLLLNVRAPPFDRPEARQAVARSIDLTRLVRAVGDAVPADHGYVHPASPWSVPETLHVFDEGSRTELGRLGLTAIEVLAPDNDPVRQEAGRQVALALERAGVRAESKAVPRDELSRAVGADGSAPSFSAAIWGSPPLASYDPDFLSRLFGSDPDDAALNRSGYRSAEFDRIAERIATGTDSSARQAATAEALRLLARDVPVVPLFFATGTYAYRHAIYDGWVFVKGAGILDKRSFLGPRRTSAPSDPRPPEAPPPSRSSPAGFIALGLVAAAAVVGGVAVARWRR